MKLLMIRHGDMAGDPYVRFSDGAKRVEGCLSATGEAQARALCEGLRGVRVDVALSSSYGRALQTAQMALAGRDPAVPIRVVPGLHEWTPSDAFRNATSTEAEAMNARDRLRYAEDTWKTELGEGTFDMAARIVPALLLGLEGVGWHMRHGGWVPDAGTEGKTVAVFAHGGSLGVMMSFVMGLPMFPVGRFSFEKTGVAQISFTERRGVYYPALEFSVLKG